MTGNSPSAQSGAKPWKRVLLAAVKGLGGLAGRALLLPAAAAIALGLLLLAWSCERQARLRQTLETEQVRQRAAEDAARLEARAAATVREARAQHEAAMREYELRRAQLEREAAGLRERLASLRRQEATQVAEVAALPMPQVADRVIARLGVEGSGEISGMRDSGLGTSEREHTWPPRLQPPAPSTQHPVPSPDSRVPTPGSRVASPESRLPSRVVLGLTESGARAVETAFVERDACRAQSAAQDAEIENCHALEQVHQSAITQQDITVKKLNAALADKDQILARREEAHRAELKLARGTRWGHFLSALKYLAAGVVVGVMLR